MPTKRGERVTGLTGEANVGDYSNTYQSVSPRISLAELTDDGRNEHGVPAIVFGLIEFSQRVSSFPTRDPK